MTKKTKQQNKTVNNWLKYQKRYAHNKLSIAIALGSFNGILMIAQTAILAYLIDLFIFSNNQTTLSNNQGTNIGNNTNLDAALFSDSTLIIITLIILILCRAALGYFTECYSRRGAMDIKSNIRARLLNRLFQFGPTFTQIKGSAKLTTLLHQGIDSLEDYYAGYLPVIAYCAVIPLAILIAVFPIDWQSGLILLFTAPMVPFFMILIGHKAQRLNEEHWAKLK